MEFLLTLLALLKNADFNDKEVAAAIVQYINKF